ncbi:MAG: response regulator [Actinomycetales bacterium]
MNGTVSGAVRVLVVDDDPLVRSALRLMLGGSATVEMVGEVGDGDEVAEAVSRLDPDVVLMDIRMRRMDGLAATRQLRAAPGAPEVLVLTTFDADDSVVAAVRAGAAGFLLKDTPPGDLVAAIERVAAGEAVLSPAVTRSLLDLVGRAEPADPGAGDDRRARARAAMSGLTDREREVAEAVARGGSNAQIGEELFMSTATVKSYVSRLLVRLGCENRVQVALLVHDATRDC